MKFKRIDVDTIRCLISEEELFENGLEVGDFFNSNEKTEDFLRKILSRAAEEVGYKIKGGNISIQVSVLPNHVLALTFSEKPDNGILNMLEHLKHAVETLSQNVQERNEEPDHRAQDGVGDGVEQSGEVTRVVSRPEYQLCFSSLDTVLDYCNSVQLEVPVETDLYKLEQESVYFLLMKKGSMSDKQLCRLLGAALEFTTGIHANDGIQAYVREHGDLIVQEKAIQQMQNI